MSGWVRVSGVELEGGTLTSSAESMCSLLVRPPSGGWGTWWVVDEVVGTLLGPEGTGPSALRERCGWGCCFWGGLLVRHTAGVGSGAGGGCGVGHRPYVENCTVDASIF